MGFTSPLRAEATSVRPSGAEFCPTMYPMTKNTPKSITTMKNTLKSWRFPRINSNSPSSFLGTLSVLGSVRLRAGEFVEQTSY